MYWPVVRLLCVQTFPLIGPTGTEYAALLLPQWDQLGFLAPTPGGHPASNAWSSAVNIPLFLEEPETLGIWCQAEEFWAEYSPGGQLDSVEPEA